MTNAPAAGPPQGDGIDCSVLIPAYNAADFILPSIQDALGQTGVAVEVLVVDDASKDGTRAVVDKLGDPRVVYRRLEANGGPAAARNVGLDLARGRWIAVLDADDRMAPTRLKSLIAIAEARGLDVVADNLWVAAGAERRLHIEEPLDGRVTPLSLEDLFNEARMGRRRAEYGYLKPVFNAAFLTRNALRYDERLRIGEDLMFVADCLAKGGRYGRVSLSAYTYVRHESSISHRLKPGQVEAMQAADEAFLRRHGERLTAGQRGAVRRHRANLVSAAAYVRMLDALKARRLQAFAGEALRHPAALPYFEEPLRKRLGLLPAKG